MVVVDPLEIFCFESVAAVDDVDVVVVADVVAVVVDDDVVVVVVDVTVVFSSFCVGNLGSSTPNWKRPAKNNPTPMQISAKFRNLSTSEGEKPPEEESSKPNNNQNTT